MPASVPRKVVRSYRTVFRRRWRIFRVQSWRLPLPGGLELRALAYFAAALGTLAALAALPLVGAAVGALPSALRLLVLPITVAWALSRWEVDGRSPHRALAGELHWALSPHTLAGLRRCPAPGTLLAPPAPLCLGLDLRAPSYPRGRLDGPVRLLLRYPVAVEPIGGVGRTARERAASARSWRLRPLGGKPLRQGRVLAVPAGRTVSFE
jgi:hypothetical protein